MAINYDKGQVPKGASNSNGLAQTPGTQATAMQNVNTGANINPNMPKAPQLAKQSRSDYQRSLGGMAPPRAPMPTQARPTSVRRPVSRPVVSRGLPMDQSRGYNIFSGMDANEISGMNQEMGLSNMTALPSLAPASTAMPAVNPALSGFGLKEGTQAVGSDLRFVSTNIPEDAYEPKESVKYWSPETESTRTATINEDGSVTVVSEDGEELASFDAGSENAEEMISKYNLSSTPTSSEDEGEDGYVLPTEEELIAEILQEQEDNQEGYDTEKMAATEAQITEDYEQSKEMLDEKYAIQLDQMLAGIDRQMAMMGTFGSGAHSFSLNNATAQALAAMADEYADLDKSLADTLYQTGVADMQMGEQEFDAKLNRKLKIADMLQKLSQIEEGEPLEKMNQSMAISSNVISEVAAFNAKVGRPEFTSMINEIEQLMVDELLEADPSEYKIIQSKYEKVVTDFMNFLAYYEKEAAKASAGDYTEGYKNFLEKDTMTKYLAPIFMTLGLIDNVYYYEDPDLLQKYGFQF